MICCTVGSTVTEIIYAGYGAEGEIPCDVTEVVRKQFAEGQRCFRASNDIFGGMWRNYQAHFKAARPSFVLAF